MAHVLFVPAFERRDPVLLVFVVKVHGALLHVPDAYASSSASSITSSLVHCFLNAISAWYSGALYQASRKPM